MKSFLGPFVLPSSVLQSSCYGSASFLHTTVSKSSREQRRQQQRHFLLILLLAGRGIPQRPKETCPGVSLRELGHIPTLRLGTGQEGRTTFSPVTGHSVA